MSAVDLGNSLSWDVVDAESLCSFQDKSMEEKPLENDSGHRNYIWLSAS